MQHLFSRKHMNYSGHDDWTPWIPELIIFFILITDLLTSKAQVCICSPLKEGRKLTIPHILHKWLEKTLTRNTTGYFNTHNTHSGCHKPGHSPDFPFQTPQLSPSGLGSSAQPVPTVQHLFFSSSIRNNHTWLQKPSERARALAGWKECKGNSSLNMATPLVATPAWRCILLTCCQSTCLSSQRDAVFWWNTDFDQATQSCQHQGTSGSFRLLYFPCLNSGPTVFKHVRVRQHPSMRLVIQFWTTVLFNCHSGLVIYFGERPKFLSDF